MDDSAPTTANSEDAVYRLRAEGGDLVVKEAGETGRHQYPFEAFAYKQLEQLGAKVPHVISADDKVLIMTALPGGEAGKQPASYANKAMLAGAAADLAKAHGIHLEGFGTAAKNELGAYQGTEGTWLGYLANVITPHVKELRPEGHLSSQDVVLIQNYWTDTLPLALLDQGSLVHGDFSMADIFVEGEAYTGIIDFGDALIGDPLMDLACFGFKEMTNEHGQGAFDLLVDGYIDATDRMWSDNDNIIICFYMIYWGISWLQPLKNGTQEREAMLERLHALAAIIAKRTSASIGYRLDGETDT